MKHLEMEDQDQGQRLDENLPELEGRCQIRAQSMSEGGGNDKEATKSEDGG